MNIAISKKAVTHFNDLIVKQGLPDLNIRIEVVDPNIEENNIDIVFCPSGEELKDDIKIQNNNNYNFYFLIAKNSEKYLKDASLDYESDQFGGKLIFNTPNLKPDNVGLDGLDNLYDKALYVLNSKINPLLAQHSGFAELVRVEENSKIIYIKLGGGCDGCHMANVTLKQLIEKNFKKLIPEIKEIVPVTL